MNAHAPALIARRALRQLDEVVALAVAASFPFALLAFYLANTPLRLLTIAMQFSAFAYMFLISDNRALKLLCVTLLALCLPVAAANAVDSDARSLLLPICLVGALGCAWCAFELRRTVWLFEYPFYAYLAVTLYLILALGYGPVEFNEVYGGISRNGYSAILFATACAYIISRDWRGKKPSLLLLACALACTVPLYGRSSIAAMAVLFAATAMKRWPRFAFLTAILAAVLIVLGSLGIDAIAGATNFRSGIESDRWTIIDEYASLLNSRTLVVGVPFSEVWAIRENGGSPDIAFLRLHSYLGIGMFFVFAWFAVSAWTLLRERRFLVLGVLVAVLLRASTDVILLFGTVDYLFIAALFYPVFSKYWPPADSPQPA
jgi:hypothetical protein